jgi:hypothetical protein
MSFHKTTQAPTYSTPTSIAWEDAAGAELYCRMISSRTA